MASSSKSRASARAAARVSKAVSSGKSSSLNARGQSIARSLSSAASSAASRAASAVSSAAQRGAARAANIAATQGMSALNARGQALLKSTPTNAQLDEFTKNRLAVLDAEAQAEMQQDPEFQQAYPEIATFFSNLGRYDIDTQQKILSQIQQAANEQVDGGFDSEEAFVKRLRDIKKSAINDKLSLFKEQEGQALGKMLGELGRNAGDAGTKFFAQLAETNALDTGTLGSFADRLVEELMRRQGEEKSASDLAIKQAEQAANADTNLADMSAEEALFIGDSSIFARREAARAERYADLLGLNADQDLLFQVPTALNMETQKTNTNAKPSDYLTSRTRDVGNKIPSSLRTPAPTTLSAVEQRAASRAKSLADRYGASSLNSRGQSYLGNYR